MIPLTLLYYIIFFSHRLVLYHRIVLNVRPLVLYKGLIWWVVVGYDWRNLVDIDTELAQVNLGLVNLSHELLVRVGNVVEGQDAPAETEEGDSAERNEGPEGELDTALVRCLL